MNVASLELCKELYELSGWDRTDKSWWIEQWGNFDTEVARYAHKQDEDDTSTIHYPAYDLGYLLRKLPNYVWSERYQEKARLWVRKDEDNWFAWYFVNGIQDVVSEFGTNADTPEDATAKLAIELFKQGILKPEATKGTE